MARPRLLVLFLLLRSRVQAAYYASIPDLWPDMANLTDSTTRPGTSPYWGGMSLEMCCRLILNQSVDIIDGQLAFVPGQTFLRGDPAVFQRFANPCSTPGPAYPGYEGSIQQGIVTYKQAAQLCPGWEATSPYQTDSWARQLIAYTLPAAIFSTNIPRRHQVTIPRQFFPRLAFPGALTLVYRLPLATLLAVVDTLMWLVVVFSLAGPMIMSGLTEALLDARILRLLDDDIRRPVLTLRQRCHLVLALVLGNVDEDPAWADALAVLDGLPHGSVWDDHVDMRTGAMLHSLISSQQSFGTVLGIGVLLFLGAFVYACIEIQSNLGVPYTSHALALGMLWMVIPHVAIVVNLAIAGSNPSAWEIISLHRARALGPVPPDAHRRSSTPAPRDWLQRLRHHFGLLPCGHAKHAYAAAWQWDRGWYKREWIERVIRSDKGFPAECTRALRLSAFEWVAGVWVIGLVLIVAPCALGALISVTTPIVGVSCKSLIPITYAISQMCLVCLGQLGFSPSRPYPGRDSRSTLAQWVGRLGQCAYYAFAGLGALSAIGGTIMFDLGTFKCVFCYIPMSQWTRRFEPWVKLFLATDVDERLYYAGRYWIYGGAGAATFLFVMLYINWWLHRHLRARYYAITDHIGGAT